MVGLLKAVKLYLQIDQEARRSRDEEVVRGWCIALNKLCGVHAERSFPNKAGQPLPRAKVVIDPAKAAKSRNQIVDELWNGQPAISVAPVGYDDIFISPMTLADGQETIVLDRLLEILN